MKKVCYKVSLCEYRQRESCKHSLDYLSVQNGSRGTSLLYENLAETDQTPSNCQFPINIRLQRLSRNSSKFN